MEAGHKYSPRNALLHGQMSSVCVHIGTDKYGLLN